MGTKRNLQLIAQDQSYYQFNMLCPKHFFTVITPSQTQKRTKQAKTKTETEKRTCCN